MPGSVNGGGKLRVLFLCTGNSCRSQMAEGWAQALKDDVIDSCSAGTNPRRLDERAVRVMAEAGVDISAQRSKDVRQFIADPLDLVITVCDKAREACPRFPGSVRMMHAGFDDPGELARDAATEDEALAHYRRVRDEIRRYIERLPSALAAGGGDE